MYFFSSPQGHPSLPRATHRFLARPPPPPPSTASRALPLCLTTLISLLTSQARWLAWLPHPPPPQVHTSYLLSKWRLKSEVDLQWNREAVSEPPTWNIKMAVKNVIFGRTDDEQYSLDSSFFSLFVLLLPLCTFLSNSWDSLASVCIFFQSCCLSLVPVLHS